MSPFDASQISIVSNWALVHRRIDGKDVLIKEEHFEVDDRLDMLKIMCTAADLLGLDALPDSIQKLHAQAKILPMRLGSGRSFVDLEGWDVPCYIVKFYD